MKTGFVLALMLALSACGGSSDNDFKVNPSGEPKAYAELKTPAPATGRLVYASATELSTLLKNGVRIDMRNSAPGLVLEDDARLGGAIADNAAPEALPTPSPDDFSETNVQVAGVDEGDYVKYDGEYLYMHAWPRYEKDENQHRIRILRTDPVADSAELASDIAIDDYLSEMQLYLLAGEQQTDQLVSLTSDGFYAFCGVGPRLPWYYGNTGEVHVDLYDLQTPAAPVLDWQLELDGMLHFSRKIGGVLYITTSYIPRIELPVPGSDDEVEALTESALEDVNLDELLPGYRINGGERQLLSSPDECLVDSENNVTRGYRSLHHLIAIDLRQRAVIDSVCLGTPVEGLYASTEAIYLFATEWTENWSDSYSVLHKFALEENAVNYAASGTVPGRLTGAAPDAAFRLDDHDGYLRTLSSGRTNSGELTHRLSILQVNADEKTLDLVSQLPNATETAAIGKPGEDVYAVRFFGDKAYVVTFQRTDPLYVLDLADPLQPKIAGELALPGFSTYLHPVGDGLLFGFGRDATEAGVQLGLKAALFDVSDPVNPETLGEVSIGNRDSWSDASYDHRAFSFLPAGDSNLRITLPATFYDFNVVTDAQGETYSANRDRALVMLEVNNINSEQPELSLHGLLETPTGESRSWQNYAAFSRGIMHGDTVYYVDEPRVWAAYWSDPTTVFGPFVGE